MLKYEEKFHFDEHYRKLQSNSALQIAIRLVWGVGGYSLLYYLIKYVSVSIPDIQPWSGFDSWLTLGGIEFIKIDAIYFVCGLAMSIYGTVKLSKITMQNHSVKTEKSNIPNQLLVTGYYGKVRHPMYGTFIILQAGFFLSLRSSIGMIVALVIIILQYINAMLEEKKQLIPIFDDEYNQYIGNVKGMLLTRREIIVFLLIILLSAVGFAFM